MYVCGACECVRACAWRGVGSYDGAVEMREDLIRSGRNKLNMGVWSCVM